MPHAGVALSVPACKPRLFWSLVRGTAATRSGAPEGTKLLLLAMSVIDPGLKRSMQKAAANEEKFKKKDEAQRAKQAEIDRKRALNAPQKEKATKKIIATQERKRAREKKEYEGEDLAGDSQMVYSIRKGSGRMCTQAAMRGPTAEWPAAWPTGRSTNRPPTSPTAVCR